MPKPIEPTRRDGRDRLLNGARSLLAEKGYAGMELRDVAERGKAPRGSIYHHFPGGKSQLAVEAAELEGREIRAAIERSLAELGLAETLSDLRRDVPPPGQGPARAARLPGRRRRPGPARGPGARRRRDRRLRELGSADRRRPAREGVGDAEAESFAGLVVSTIEGALLRARAAGDQAPLDSAVAGLHQALEALLADV